MKVAPRTFRTYIMKRTFIAAIAPTLGLVIASLFPAGAVEAQSARSEYQVTIDRALEEFEARRWEEARTLFQRAHELEPNARTLRAIGMVSFELRDYVSSLVAFESALTDERRPLSNAQRQEVERLLSDARTFVAAYELEVNPMTATVSVDGLPAVIRDGRLLLNPGSHDVRIVAEGFEESVVQVDSRGGHSGEIAVVLRLHGRGPTDTEPSELSEPELPVASSPAPAPRSRGLAIAGWSTLAAGVAVGGVSLGLGLKSHSIYEELEPLCPCPDRTDDIDRGEALGRASTATTFVGIAAAATGGTLLVVNAIRSGAADDDGAGVAFTAGPGDLGAGVAVRF
jgi:hypothetical protein